MWINLLDELINIMKLETFKEKLKISLFEKKNIQAFQFISMPYISDAHVLIPSRPKSVKALTNIYAIVVTY